MFHFGGSIAPLLHLVLKPRSNNWTTKRTFPPGWPKLSIWPPRNRSFAYTGLLHLPYLAPSLDHIYSSASLLYLLSPLVPSHLSIFLELPVVSQSRMWPLCGHLLILVLWGHHPSHVHLLTPTQPHPCSPHLLWSLIPTTIQIAFKPPGRS